MGRRLNGVGALIALVVMAPALQGCALLLMGGQGSVETAAPAVVSPLPLPSANAAPSLAPGALPTPDQLASLLGPGDFSAVGIEGAGPPSYDPAGEPGSVYAVYRGLSGAAGGLEVDVFVPGSADDAAAMVFDPGLFALDAETKAAIGAERATLIDEQATNDGTATYDTLWVQDGRLVAVISIPTSEGSRDQLLGLATLLLARSAAYQ